MSNITASVRTVPFHGDNLFLTEHDGQPFVPMKPIVDGMGMAWQTQHRKLMSDRFSSTITEMVIVAGDGKNRTMTCLPLRKLPGWLMTIQPNKIKNTETRAKVIQYQNECDDVLWSYWTDGIAVNPRAFPLTTEHQHGLKAEIDRRVYANVNDKSKRRLAYARIWNYVKDRFQVAKYEDIPDRDYTQALAAVHAAPIEGEWLSAPETPKLEIHYPVSEWRAKNPHFEKHNALLASDKMRIAAEMLYTMDQHSPTLKLLKSLERTGYVVDACLIEVQGLRHFIGEYHDYIKDFRRIAGNLLERTMTVRYHR